MPSLNCDGKLPLFSWNFGIITLLSKQKEATLIKQYHPICLLNVRFKIFIKVVVNRMTESVDQLISPSQTAFIPERNIMDGVVMLHETIHICGAWTQNMNTKRRKIFMVRIGVMLWAIWLSQNDIGFDETPILLYMQVIYRGTHWSRTWSIFQKDEERNYSKMRVGSKKP
jgi:hypothetical protein